jgi:hypothetical protein
MVPVPPIRAASGFCPAEQPIAIAGIGVAVVIWSSAIDEDATVAMVPVVMVPVVVVPIVVERGVSAMRVAVRE